MKNVLTRGFIFFLPFFFFSCSNSPDHSIKELKMLNGTWESATNIIFFEDWRIIDDTTLRGIGYSIDTNADTTFMEQLLIQKAGNKINYVATVRDQNHARPVIFKLEKHYGNTFIFENSEHDYPGRIIYSFETDTLVNIQLETIKGTRQQRFSLKKECRKKQ